MPNKNVLIDLERMRYPNSGLAYVCKALLKGLKDIKQVDNFTFYTDKDTHDFIQVKKKLFWKTWHKVLNINIGKYQVLHVTHQSSTYFPNFKDEKIVTLHDLNFLYEGKSDRKVKKEIECINKNLKNTKTLVCISEFTKNDFLKNKHLFEYSNDMSIEVINNGLVFEDYSENIINKEYSELIKKDFFLNIGVLNPKKNQLVLLEMLVDFPDTNLVLVFSSKKTDYFDSFIKKAKKLGVFDRLIFLQNISEIQKQFLLENCKALLHPSIAEGFGIPPIEAMYYGKPVFVSNKTSLPEIAGKEAYYWDSFDVKNMVEVLKNGLIDYDSEIKDKQKRIKDWALKYNHLEMAKKYLKLYLRHL